MIYSMYDPSPNSSTFEPISIDKLQTLFNDKFCAEILLSFNQWERSSFGLDDNGIIVRTSNKGNQIIAPN